MAKRLSDSNKWNDDWFLDLPMDIKLVWLYILDNCDHAGVYKVNMKLLRFQTGIDRPENEIIDYFKDRIYVFNGKWFIPKFVTFQYKNFFTNNAPAVKSARELLISHGIIKPNDNSLPTFIEPLPNPSVTLIEPLDNPYIRTKDKDMDKDTDKDKDMDSDIDTYRNKGNTRGITERILDILLDANSDNLLYKRAVDDWNDLGGIEEVSTIMEWGDSEKTNWKKRLDNVYEIKQM